MRVLPGTIFEGLVRADMGPILREPAVRGTIRDGSQLEHAIVERRWLLTSKKYAPDDAISLLFTVPANWQESELGLSIKQYAPQAFSSQA